MIVLSLYKVNNMFHGFVCYNSLLLLLLVKRIDNEVQLVSYQSLLEWHIVECRGKPLSMPDSFILFSQSMSKLKFLAT